MPPPARINTPRRADHRPTRSSPLVVYKPLPMTSDDALSSEEDAADNGMGAETLDEIAMVERFTTQRASALIQLEDKLNETEANLRRILLSLREQVENTLETKISSKLLALTTIMEAERNRIEDVRSKALATRKEFVDDCALKATLETEAKVEALSQRVNEMLEAKLANNRQSALSKICCRPISFIVMTLLTALCLSLILAQQKAIDF